MRISSLSLVIAVPFLVVMAIILPLVFNYEYEFLFPWLLVPVTVLICLYIFRPQIDQWWVMRNDIPLDKPLVQWLSKHSRFYAGLNQNDKKRFEKKVQRFLSIKDFSLKAAEDHTPGEEFKLIAIHEALRITHHMDDYYFPVFDTIILYPHAFPTPLYKRLHTLEVHETDGVVLLSQPHLVNGLLNPDQYFNIGLYAWISVFIRENPRIDYPVISKENLEKLNALYPYSVDQITEVIGLGFISPLTLHAHAFFQFATIYQEAFPSQFGAFQSIFSNAPETK